jgi:hypothetical protein
MKKINFGFLPGLLSATALLLLATGCHKASLSKTRTYTLYTPVFQSKQSVLASINSDPAKTVDSMGKLYIKDNFIFLNDVDKGIHVIDNSNPANPVQIAFLKIPGNQDIAIKGNILYADMYSDLLAIDITDIHHVQVSSLLPTLFQDRESVDGFYMDSSQVIVSMTQKDTTVPIENNNNINSGLPVYYDVPEASNAAASTGGVASSSAKMVLINNFLYAITEMHQLGAIDISIPENPVLASNQFAGYDLETIFPFKDKLFLGSDIGTFIYDVSNPANPVETGTFTHGQACDPVITDGTDAYITLHAGTSCGGASNELDVVNVQNLLVPFLVKTYPMISPKGLSKDGDLLFVCDGPEEVKLFNASNPDALQLLSVIKNQGPYDVIAANQNLMVVATLGLYQYNYSDPGNVRLLSFFAVK